MGQRTQVAVIRENKDGKKRMSLYHHQWGIGTVMYEAFMGIVCETENMGGHTGRDFLDLPDFPDYSRFLKIGYEFTSSASDDEVIAGCKNLKIESFREVFGNCDNNNGAMVVYLKESERRGVLYKVGFLLGGEDCPDGEEPFSRWLSPEQYSRAVNGESRELVKFLWMFRAFIELEGVEEITENND